MSVLNQTVTNFATLVQLIDKEGTGKYERYISTMDQQQLVDLLSYCIGVNRYAENQVLTPGLFDMVQADCLDELMKRAVSEPF